MIPPEVVVLSPYAPAWVARSARRRVRQRIRDRAGRVVEIDEWRPDDWDALLAMYLSLDPAQRTLRLPPLGEERQAAWLDQLLARGPNVVARAGGRVVGHAALAAGDGASQHALVVFVHQGYQRAGIGGALVDAVRRLARRQEAQHARLMPRRGIHRSVTLDRRSGPWWPSRSLAVLARTVRRLARSRRTARAPGAGLLPSVDRPGATEWGAPPRSMWNDNAQEAIGR